MGWISALLESVGGSSAAGGAAAGAAGAGAGAAGAAAGGAGAGAGIGAGLSTIGGTGLAPAAAAPSVASVAGFNPGNYLAGAPTGGGSAGLLSRLYGPVGEGLKRAGTDISNRGAGSPYESLGNAIGGQKGADVGRTIGGISSLAGGPGARPGSIYPNQRPALPPPGRSPLVGGQSGGAPQGSGYGVDGAGFIMHRPDASAPATAGLPIRVGY